MHTIPTCYYCDVEIPQAEQTRVQAMINYHEPLCLSCAEEMLGWGEVMANDQDAEGDRARDAEDLKHRP